MIIQLQKKAILFQMKNKFIHILILIFCSSSFLFSSDLKDFFNKDKIKEFKENKFIGEDLKFYMDLKDFEKNNPPKHYTFKIMNNIPVKTYEIYNEDVFNNSGFKKEIIFTNNKLYGIRYYKEILQKDAKKYIPKDEVLRNIRENGAPLKFTFAKIQLINNLKKDNYFYDKFKDNVFYTWDYYHNKGHREKKDSFNTKEMYKKIIKSIENDEINISDYKTFIYTIIYESPSNKNAFKYTIDCYKQKCKVELDLIDKQGKEFKKELIRVYGEK